MFQRRLKALQYVDWEKFNGNDVQHYRKLIVWIEDQKIRHYTIKDREHLRDITNTNKWQMACVKYLKDVGCPGASSTSSPLDQLEWLLGLAVRLEFEDNLEKYKSVKSTRVEKKNAVVPTIKSTNPLDNLNFGSNDFKAGVDGIAKLLKIAPNPNHLLTLEACSKVVCARLNSTALADPNTVVVRGKPFPIMDTDLGFNMGDRVLNNSAKALSLLYIQDLRDLQTKINEAIVSVQTITANPKTDTRLGKVGI